MLEEVSVVGVIVAEVVGESKKGGCLATPVFVSSACREDEKEPGPGQADPGWQGAFKVTHQAALLHARWSDRL